MCCTNAKWKREVVPDHKFDFIDVRDFRVTTFGTRLQYAFWVWIIGAISFAVYIADIYTAVALLASNRWSNTILESDAAKNSTALQVPFTVGKWIFTGCIGLSFLLLAWEVRKARAIIKSRDISYAFTNVLSQDYYSMKSYNHFCFFSQIENSKKKKDELAFFIFFTFKGWKRLILADAPRQVVNGMTLYAFGKSQQWSTNFSDYTGGSVLKAGIILTMLFTLTIWVISAALLLIAAILYVPLLCYIQGNLKEYCCHKADKRIADLMKRKNRKRMAEDAEIAKKEARGDFSHLRDKKGKFTAAPLPQPTLPKIGIADEDLFATGSEKDSMRTGAASSMKKSGSMDDYAYPPSSSNGTIRQGSNLSRPPYAGGYPSSMSYNNDASSYFYAESTHSTDDFAHRGADFGYDQGFGESTLGLTAADHTGRGGGGASSLHRPTMSNAPSYHSQAHEYGYANGGGSEKYAQSEKYGNEQFGAMEYEYVDQHHPAQHQQQHLQPLSQYPSQQQQQQQQQYQYQQQQQQHAVSEPDYLRSHERSYSNTGSDQQHHQQQQRPSSRQHHQQQQQYQQQHERGASASSTARSNNGGAPSVSSGRWEEGLGRDAAPAPPAQAHYYYESDQNQNQNGQLKPPTGRNDDAARGGGGRNARY